VRDDGSSSGRYHSPVSTAPDSPEILALRGGRLRVGERVLWDGLDLTIAPGELVAVLGANGVGKSSLLRVVLGQQRLEAGDLRFLGEPVRRGEGRIGYVPQQKLFDRGAPLRARDLVAFGLDGTTYGPVFRRGRRARIDELLAHVGASAYADSPVGILSGGEQQRLRIAQALAGEPRLLLCDEPLLSLDLAQQAGVSALIDRYRTDTRSGVLFVTHDINPILASVDRVLYLAPGRHAIGTPAEVLRSDVLSDLYGTTVDVVEVRGRIVVVGAPEAQAEHEHERSEGQA
jgi:zinc/manganese transport system ATP-binding protein